MDADFVVVVALDHLSELLEGLRPLLAQQGFPVVEELSAPFF